MKTQPRNRKGQFTKQKTMWKKIIKIAIYVLAAVGAALGFWQLQGCRATHQVIQSSQQSQWIKGDTTVTEISIKYEQAGNIRK